jgi:hypothetical protein
MIERIGVTERDETAGEGGGSRRHRRKHAAAARSRQRLSTHAARRLIARQICCAVATQIDVLAACTPHKMQLVGQSARASRRRLLSTHFVKRG